VTVNLLFGDEIRSHVLKILSGECVFVRRSLYPKLYILSPWISDVVIDFSDRYVSKEVREFEEKGKVESFLILDYNIKSINLPYALLLFKLHGACNEYQNIPEVNIVTLPPDESNYSPDYLPRVKTLLDFLDEIGCNVFVNSKLHSKLLLANDLALLGSFNLSSSALLYNREEIGVSINDLDNLENLEAYCLKVLSESERYGHTSLLNYGKRREKSEIERDWHLTELLAEAMGKPPSLEREARIKELLDQSTDLFQKNVYSPKNGITRGWLLDLMIGNAYRGGYGEFLFITGGYDKAIKSYATDLNLFYLMSLRRLITSPEGKSLVVNQFKLKDDESTDSIMKFLNNKFARKTVPNIRLRVKSLK
jgi:hypothetical protein